MNKKSFYNFAVIGLGFGDEGKGLTVNSLAQSLPNPLVVRYSGGQQAGHTVTLPDGRRHVFSNFGSGSFQDVPTYWSKLCTFDPVGVINELATLTKLGVDPILFVDKQCPVTTPYDKMHNQTSEISLKHGTVGCGVGATKQREADFYSLLVGDLNYDSILDLKLKLISDYYGLMTPLGNFIEAICVLRGDPRIHFVNEMPNKYHNYIFESSQGLLLDQHHGFFPHVTRSVLGPRPIIEMGRMPYLYLVTRAFQTRHGNGPMTNLHLPHNIKDNPNETNVNHTYQGEFKKSLLDLDLLRYAIDRDEYIRTTPNKELVITCTDLIQDEYRFTISGNIHAHSDEESFAKAIGAHLGIDKIHLTNSPSDVLLE